MIKISLSKEIFDKVVSKELKILKKEANKHWRKNLLEPKLIGDSIFYEIKKINKITLTHGLGEDKPQVVLEVKEINRNDKEGVFEFSLGRIIEQKNMDMKEDQNEVIEKLRKEKEELEAMLRLLINK